jgi:hypothetical protein
LSIDVEQNKGGEQKGYGSTNKHLGSNLEHKQVKFCKESLYTDVEIKWALVIAKIVNRLLVEVERTEYYQKKSRRERWIEWDSIVQKHPYIAMSTRPW